MKRLTLILLLALASGACGRMSRSRLPDDGTPSPSPAAQAPTPVPEPEPQPRPSVYVCSWGGRQPTPPPPRSEDIPPPPMPRGQGDLPLPPGMIAPPIPPGSAAPQPMPRAPSAGAEQCSSATNTDRLVEIAADQLCDAMSASEGPHLMPWDRARAEPMKLDLYAVTDCLGKALRLSPDSYPAHLLLGTAYLMLARTAYQSEPVPGRDKEVRWVPGSNWKLYVDTAKHHLGLAYMLRVGQYEPLYYLAETALEEGNHGQARRFLAPLEQAGHKLAPVYAMQGFMAEREGNLGEADRLYQKALQTGWPRATFDYALQRLTEHSKPKKPAPAAAGGAK